MGSSRLKGKGGKNMSRSASKKTDDALQPQSKQPNVDKVVRTIKFKDFLVNRSLRESGPLRISFPQELPEELREKWDTAFSSLTLEEQEQIEVAAREVRPRFFRERFGDNAEQ